MKILIIKLGALGDVVRTTPIAEALKKKYHDSDLVWITKSNAVDILKGNEFIDEIHTMPYFSEGKFDILYNFDIDDDATSLALKLNADKKYGFYSEKGYLMAYNIGAEYYLNTIFDDDVKRENIKTYQEMMFETADLSFNKEKPRIYLTDSEKNYAKNFCKLRGIDVTRLIGIHVGTSSRWPSKMWSIEKIEQFILKLKKENYDVLVFGGIGEKDRISKILYEMKKKGMKIFSNNLENTIKEFSSLVEICKAIVCSDSFSLHISIALNKPTVGLFFCTSPNEVEGYGVLKKVVSPLLNDFFPQRSDVYSEKLVNSISVESVVSSLREVLRINL